MNIQLKTRGKILNKLRLTCANNTLRIKRISGVPPHSGDRKTLKSGHILPHSNRSMIIARNYGTPIRSNHGEAINCHCASKTSHIVEYHCF